MQRGRGREAPRLLVRRGVLLVACHRAFLVREVGIVIEHVPRGYQPRQPPSNQQRYDRWLPLFNQFRARERGPSPTTRKTP